jgi:hypothetical protein
MSSPSDSKMPILTSDSNFTKWQSVAKSYLRNKECFSACTQALAPHTIREKAAGVLWMMLGDDAKNLCREHEDDPMALWNALPILFAPQKAGTRFNAYQTLTSIKLEENESLLSLTSRVKEAMDKLKRSRPTSYTLADVDKELHAVVLLMALPESYSTLTAPFEQASTLLDPKEVEAAFVNKHTFKKESSTPTAQAMSAILLLLFWSSKAL